MARYIDADSFIEKLKVSKEYQEKYATFREVKMTEFFIESVKEQPTADVVEVKHGEWIKNQYISQVLKIPVKKEFVFTCSLCGHDTLGKSKYCRECGAKMDGGKAE